MSGDVKTKKENSMHEGATKLPIIYRLLRVAIIIVLCALILGGGAFGAIHLFNTGPRPKMATPKKIHPLVQVQEVNRGTEHVTIKAMGTVIPAHQIVLKSRVGGEVVFIHPEFSEGGFLKKGDEILRLDAKDYTLAIKKTQSLVANAEYAMKLELGQQDIAKAEWEMLNGQKKATMEDAELALRKPHLEKTKADLASAKADLEQAKINLARTKVKAPFNAVVRSKNVDMGSIISTQDQLSELVGADEYWISVPLPMDRLRWIRIPKKSGDSGSVVRIYTDNSSESPATHSGTVFKLLSDLEDDGRMPRILVSVKDPLGIKSTDADKLPLLLNQYVRVEIEGLELEDVIRVPRSSLRDNSRVWVLDSEDKLRIKNAQTVWRDEDTVILRDGFQPTERLIVSDISTPVEGMQLRTSSENGIKSTPALQPTSEPFPASGAPGKGNFMDQDMDKDGKVSKTEFKGSDMIFKMIDRDGDGFVTQVEVPKGPPPGGAAPRS